VPISSSDRYRKAVIREETIQVSGVRCERCVMRLAKTLEGHPGLEAANANLMGQVSLAWDDERTERDEILTALRRGGFREISKHNA
jgi:copper chaperone CopZ